jgi:hypothetical protein
VEGAAVEEGEEREEEGEEEGRGSEGEEQEALGAQEVVRRGGSAPLPLHCFALWPAATAERMSAVDCTVQPTLTRRSGSTVSDRE